MKVLKFGGSSVGTAASLLNVKQIVESCDEPCIVVVSALGGITDRLLEASRAAAAGDGAWRETYLGIRERHLDLVRELLPCSDTLEQKISVMADSLESLLYGVCAIKVLPAKTGAEIVSFGERMSAEIVNELLSGSELRFSPDFIKTRVVEGRTVLNMDITDALVKQAFGGFNSGVAVVPGFISADSVTGEITNLGRGGSDYTASIIAAALDARVLEIWTDVDGFMTADPRIISTSYVIESLSYVEAMELCHFGAKVVYAPALYPVFPKDIPVYIKNTFNPSAKGTVIRREAAPSARPLTGITSIKDISLLTLSAPSMVGIIGVDGRLFGALSRSGISVFLVSQSSSETGISVGVGAAEAERAKEAVDAEFADEIARGAMHPAAIESDLVAVAVVGANLKHSKGVAGKLFTTLARNDISVLACAQGSSEHNISMVIAKDNLRKALNVIHDGFFLSEYKELNLFVCGVGTVGGQLLDQIASQRERLMRERGLKINIVGIARSTCGVFKREGIDSAKWREVLASSARPLDLQGLKEEVIGMNIFNSVFVDVTASHEVAALYKEFFEHGVSVVTANKVAASSDYANYLDLKRTAFEHGVKFLFETNVGAGLPIINTVNALRGSGDRIVKIEAVVSGTLNFIVNTLSADIPFSQTVRMAKEQGFSEPDPRLDLSGTDVIRKLVILAREAGYKVDMDQVEAKPLIPAEFFECPLEEFWRRLPELDASFEAERKRLESENKRWRYVARMQDGRFTVGLDEFKQGHSFYVLEGSNNIVLLTTERYNLHPMLIQGYGAGASVTAAGVFADIMSIANV